MSRKNETQTHSMGNDCNQEQSNYEEFGNSSLAIDALAVLNGLQNAKNELQLLQIENLEERFKTFRQIHERHVARVAALKAQLDADWALFCVDVKAYNDGYEI
ncbi:uncharacterized protein LOC111065312 [Drosophila obscura]|uniref:uncharacterized protein LOC111065312 n=1 Tax=Drosophila obscura TaxID=7282 RepID=UPI001BB27A3E|nr:uncharacterized protein LOC111065312 [Drosophila obscura]